MTQHTIYGEGGFDPAKPYGNALAQWDDTTRTHSDYTVTPAAVRTYTADENTAADARLALQNAKAARETARATIKAIIVDLKAEKDRADAVIAKTNAQITGGDTKDVARAAKRIADAAIDLARFTQDI